MRSVLCFALITVLMLSSVLRVAVVATADYGTFLSNQTLYRIPISNLRGTVYDCNMVPITNTATDNIAAILPTSQAVTSIKSELFDDLQLDSVIETLNNGKPTICEVDGDLNCEGIATTRIYRHNPEYLYACHLIGYTDKSGHGVTGIELAYDDLLYSGKTASAVFTVNGAGNVLKGVKPYFENDLSVINSGVVTTIDLNIQIALESAISAFESGCAVVAEAKTGKIRGYAAVPTFDINDFSKSVNDKNSPFLNRPLCAYSVGSVFKPCVAAAAIENGLGNTDFVCEGSLKIVDRVFKCHNRSGHGAVDLCGALAQSCNCYFYNLSIQLGGEKICRTASTLNFGSKIKIADNMYTSTGSLPEIDADLSDGAVANLGIGQGELLLSPVSVLTLYSAIAGDGSYYLPSVVEKTIKDGKESIYDIGNPTRVMSKQTAEKLREYLKTVITDGTGTSAAPENCTAAGKTATAQTGRYYDDGQEITNSWFCGFFPAEDPQYVAVIMCDGKTSISTASVFAQIADRITEIGNK